MDAADVNEDAPMIAVVIGRNEGDRLRASLQSVKGAGVPVVYSDSASKDESRELADNLGIPVIQLSIDKPLSAGRGRNEGLREAHGRWPEARYVLFLDGDCVLELGFCRAAIETFEQHPTCAIVTGHLFERHPEASIYNRLCAIEWRSPVGLIENMNGLGGIMAARISAFEEVRGFNLDAIAGEEPDLGIRLKLAGYSIMKIDRPMATHDADIMSFRQWWTRAVRGGHALAHRYAEHGRTRFRDGRRELMSDLFWGLALPLLIAVLVWPTRGFALALAGSYGLLAWRVYRHYRRGGINRSDAMLVTRFILYSKFAHVIGIARYCWNRLRGEFKIIEYK
jgi:GT2 family glycosyltransferase